MWEGGTISSDGISYKAAISAYEDGQWEAALTLFEDVWGSDWFPTGSRHRFLQCLSKEHVPTQTLAVDFNNYNTIQHVGLYCIEIYSKSLGGDMFLAMAWSCVGAFVQSGIGPHESSQSANSVGTNWCTNRSFDPWWFFRQLVMRNALTKKKTDRRTSVEPKLIEVVGVNRMLRVWIVVHWLIPSYTVQTMFVRMLFSHWTAQ